MDKSDLPTYDQLMLPTIQWLKEEGGSSRRQEIVLGVAILKDLSDAHLDVRYDTSGVPIFADRVSWALSYLKMGGATDNSQRGVWSLTELGWQIDSEDQVNSLLKDVISEKDPGTTSFQVGRDGDDKNPALVEVPAPYGEAWKGHLLEQLLGMSPNAFERLTQRLLREAGFRDVEVLGRSGDRGIDGVGVLRLSLVSFPVFFQCKRYRGQIVPSDVRDFRGAMTGRGEKGLLVTTGTFTSEAIKEANRDGAPPVELIDGEDLCDLLKQYELGVEMQMVERVEIDPDFFGQFEST